MNSSVRVAMDSLVTCQVFVRVGEITTSLPVDDLSANYGCCFFSLSDVALLNAHRASKFHEQYDC